MKFYIPCISIIIATFSFNLRHPVQQEKISSSDYDRIIYSAFLQSQNSALVTEKIILSCKFKSMNRKSTRSPKLKDKISKSKI